MDAFTDDPGRIGVPVFGSGAHFQQNVANLDVYSSVKGIVTGSQLNAAHRVLAEQLRATKQRQCANVRQTYLISATSPPTRRRLWLNAVHNHDARQTLLRSITGAKFSRRHRHRQSTKNNPDWTLRETPALSSHASACACPLPLNEGP